MTQPAHRFSRSYRIQRGNLIIAQLQQVQKFHMNPSLEGRLLLIDPGFLGARRRSLTESALEMTGWPGWLELPS